jgi:hypothetical protein
MHFSADKIRELREEHAKLFVKCHKLIEAYVYRTYWCDKAKEYAIHGVSRRMKIIIRCVDNTFLALPPEVATLPLTDDLADAVINIQSFVFNIFGAIDNLAWIWVSEKGLLEKNETPLRPRSVGLGKKNMVVRGSLSVRFQEYLNELDSWFENLENFRHALAHRIPLYIPPYTVANGNMAAYEQIQGLMNEAMKNLNFEEYDRLEREQKALASFAPVITHSFEERSNPIYFHYQMLADFNTVEKIGNMMLENINT